MRFIDLQEGPNDPGIFKAIFLAGGPGSGKSYVSGQLGLVSRGLKVINSDDAFEYLMRKRNLSFEMPPEEQPWRDVARSRAKDITSKKQNLYLDGRLGLIIDGTAKDPDKMAKLKAELESIGYQTMMVFVNTSLRTALQRNLLRDRKVPSEIVVNSHKLVQANKEVLSDVFAPNYVEVNNDENPNFNDPLKRVDKFLAAPLTPQARDWVSKAQVQKSVTQEDVQNKPKVYVDMDGVLANFYAGVTAATGHEEPRAMALQDIEDTMASFAGTDFFYKLPKYDQADQLIAMVNKMSGGDWYILSSPLKYDREGSAKHKAAWVREFLKIQPKGMHFTGDKAQFATQPDGTPNILIDDYPKYLNSWTDKGGIGVKYKGHVGNIGDVKATLDKYLGDGVDETIRKVDGGYRLLSKKGKNLGTYPSKAGAEKRERQIQYFKHMGEKAPVEPHEPGYQHSYLTAPQNTLVIDKSDDMDFYKLGQHYTHLANYDKHELGVGPSDMTITFASPEEMERMKKILNRLGVAWKDIGGSHEEPEIHTGKLGEVADSPYDYIQNVKTPEKRAYRFQTDAGQLYRVQVFDRHRPDVKNFGISKNLEIHFDLTNMKTGKPETGVTGTGDAVRVFSTVAAILQKEVKEQQPTGIVIASKADDESRVKLYRTLARRATKLMPDYEVAGEKSVTGADGNSYLTIELKLKK
jgi:cytidylate kinase